MGLGFNEMVSLSKFDRSSRGLQRWRCQRKRVRCGISNGMTTWEIIFLVMMWIDVLGEAMNCDGSKCRSLGKIMLIGGLKDRKH